jgi:U4/U6 small nuclear ribonucleoprotein PRP31
MSTLADELLNDFEDSDSDGGGEQHTGLLRDDATPPATNGAHAPEESMILDGDEENVDEDEEMDGAPLNGAVVDIEDEEETKAKVEKMQLGGVNDVRSVAGLMKTLEPVLEVRVISLPFKHFI